MNENERILESISTAAYYTDKLYLDSLSEYVPCQLSQAECRPRHQRLFRVNKLVFDKDENINDKLVNIYGALSQFTSSVILLVSCRRSQISLYIGIKSKRNADMAGRILHDAFMANFPGSVLEDTASGIGANTKSAIHEIILDTLLDDCLESDLHVGCVNVIPSIRGERTEKYIQGLEKYLDTMRDENYMLEIICSPVPNSELEDRLGGFQGIYSVLSAFSKKTLSQGLNYGETLTEGVSDSVSQSISQGISLTTATSTGTSEGKQSGFNIGGHFLASFGFSRGRFEAVSKSKTSSEGEQNTSTEQRGRTTQKSETTSIGTTDTTTTEYRDKAIEDLLEKIEMTITRLKEGTAFGLWDCSAYIISTDKKTIGIGNSTFKSLMLGKESRAERTHVSIFGSERSEVTDGVLKALEYCEHPRFIIPKTSFSDQQIVRSAVAVSGKEMAVLMSLPRKSVPGVPVLEMAEFGRNIHMNAPDADRRISIGHIYHMDQVEPTKVFLDVDSLASHCFITGSTGSGKSNTVYTLIRQLYELKDSVPFLIIEPAKGEYRKEFGALPGINIFGTNSRLGQVLKVNPFYFNSAIHILEHMDRLVEVFNACWEMYAAMPAILKEAIERAYVNKGWDLLNSVYTKPGNPGYPTFSDLLAELPKVINMSGYSSDTKGDYTGALVTRVQSLTNGLYGQIFCDDFDIEDSVLFDHNTIIDLSRIGSTETKSLIMGILVLRLTEYRVGTSAGMNSRLKHVTVLEEAHNLLKNTANIRSTAGNQIVAKSVEMITTSIAEMRTYGEGFIIVDQSPTAIDIAAIKNTNTKIIMRLPEKDDADIAGRSVSLDDKQVVELSRLKVGVGVVMQSNWPEAVLSKIQQASHEYLQTPSPVSYETLKRFRSEVVTVLIEEYAIGDSHDIARILYTIERFDIGVEHKEEMKRYIRVLCGRMNQGFDSLLFGRSLKRLTACGDAFKMCGSTLKKEQNEPGSSTEVHYTSESVNSWKNRISESLNMFITVDKRLKNIIIQYIVYAQQYEYSEVKYSSLYNELYRIQ